MNGNDYHLIEQAKVSLASQKAIIPICEFGHAT